MKVSVIIPCYNEEKTIEKVVRDAKAALPEAVIYVYNNNSTDRTAELAEKAGAVVRQEYKQGKGNVIRRMFQEVDALCYIMVDGDDTYPMENAREMADLVLECESCHGKRFKKEVLEVKYHDRNIYDILEMTVNEAIEFFTLHKQTRIVKKLLPLQSVGLGYIKLGQPSTTLSGGESQRVKLATELSKRDTGRTVYILDEPTTGLHFEDIRVLMNVLNRLVDKGNTVIVIEHNLDVIKMADYLIDMGPEGGKGGGQLLSCGTPEEVALSEKGYTPEFIREELGMCKP